MTRVLIVEDEESFADPLAFLLRKEGFTTAIAADPTLTERQRTTLLQIYAAFQAENRGNREDAS